VQGENAEVHAGHLRGTAAHRMVQPAAGGGHEERNTSKRRRTGSSQKLQLFMRANAMSGAPIIIGICQLAKPRRPA